MPDFTSWAPPEREEFFVTLPVALEAEIQEQARRRRSTPSGLISDALATGIDENWTVSNVPPSEGPYGARRAVPLDPELSEALRERLAKHRPGHDVETNISELAARYLVFYLHTRLATSSGESSPEG